MKSDIKRGLALLPVAALLGTIIGISPASACVEGDIRGDVVISEHDAMLDCALQPYVRIDVGGKLNGEISERTSGLHPRPLTQPITGRRFPLESCGRGRL